MVLSVIIPAHDEEGSLGRLLAGLVASGDALDIIVVANGCRDGTAELARTFTGVRVLETATPGKREAQELGDAHARHGVRAYVDADVVISGADLLMTAEPVLAGAAEAAAPRAVHSTHGASLPVRSYYAVWQRLPQVQEGLFGRGVVVLSESARQAVAALPAMMSDDLVMSESVAPADRLVVDAATVTVRAPRSLGALLNRRVRVATGNQQADAAGLRTTAARTSVGSLVRMAGRDRRVAVNLPAFLLVTALARRRARRAVRSGDYTTWLRDETSRDG